MIVLLAVSAAFLVGTLYHAVVGFWKKPRLALVTFVLTFMPAAVVLSVSDLASALTDSLNGWAYLALVYLAAHLSGVLAYCWIRISEKVVRLFHQLKVGLITFLCITVVWFIVMQDEGELIRIGGSIVIAGAVFGGLWLFRLVRGKWKGGEKESETEESRPGESHVQESHQKDSKAAPARIKSPIKNVRHWFPDIRSGKLRAQSSRAIRACTPRAIRSRFTRSKTSPP